METLKTDCSQADLYRRQSVSTEADYEHRRSKKAVLHHYPAARTKKYFQDNVIEVKKSDSLRLGFLEMNDKRWTVGKHPTRVFAKLEIQKEDIF